MRKLFTLACLVFSIFSSAQELRNPEVVTGQLIKVIPSLKNLRPDPSLNPRVTRDETGLLIKKTFKAEVFDYGTSAPGDPVLQKVFGEDPLQSPQVVPQVVAGTVLHRNFDGMGYSTVAPADPTICAGPDHVIQMINGRQGSYLRIWDKAANNMLAQTYMYLFFGTPTYSGAGDPIVLYDQFADRYVITEFGFSDGVTGYINTLILAVSMTDDPTGGWNVYKYKDNGFFVDYPHYAAWPDVYYATSNDFNTAGTAYLGSSVYAFEKAKMLAGDSVAQMQRFRLTSTQYSKFVSIAPVNISGPTPLAAGSPGLFLYYHDDNRTANSADRDSVGFISLEADFDVPANTVLTFEMALNVAAFKADVCGGSSNCVPSGSPSGYDALSDRFMNKIYYRNFGTHESIVGTHTVNANFPAAPAKAGIRWYEFRRSGGGNWGIHQQSTYSPDADGRFVGSININKKGQIAVIYNSSASGKFASIRAAGRNANDAAGTLTYTEKIVKSGEAYGTFSFRWGDYNDLVVDPAGDSTFWFTAMYGSSTWKTRLASIIFEEQYDPDTIYNVTVPPQVDTSFSTKAYPSAYQYQWQIDSGTGYKNLLASSIFSNVNTNILGLTNLPSYLTGFKFRCKITTAADSLFRETFIVRFSSTWTGAINTSWENTGNWSSNILPDEYTDLVIPAGHNVVLSSNAYCKSLILGAGSTLTIMSGFNLYVQGKPF